MARMTLRMSDTRRGAGAQFCQQLDGAARPDATDDELAAVQCVGILGVASCNLYQCVAQGQICLQTPQKQLENMSQRKK